MRVTAPVEIEVPGITELAVIATADIQTTFSTPGSIQPLLDRIAERARSFVPDVHTSAGRKAVASLAAKVSKAKTTIDDMGKELVDGLKELPKKVDVSRKQARDFLDALRDEVRKPLTDWEAEEARKVAEAAEKVEAERKAKEMATAHELANFMNADFDRKAEERKQAAELARKQNEERIARESADKATREAEARAKAEQEASARREREAKEAQERAERQKSEAEARAKAAEERAASERQQAAEREQRASEDATRRERERRQAEELKAKQEQDRREADKKHRSQVLAEVTEDLLAFGIDSETASDLALAISLGKIRHTGVKF
jgi:colicin import membrane protein